MSPEEARVFYEASSRRDCPLPKNDRGQAMTDPMLLSRAFHPRYQSQYVAAVQTIRQQRAAAAELQQALAALPANNQGLSQYQHYAQQRAVYEGFLDTSERQALQQALADGYERTVGPGLEARAAKAAAAARGLDGLTELEQLAAEFRSLADAAGVPAKLPAALEQRRTELAAEVAASERARIDALGSGLVGVERGVDWYRDYQQRLAQPLGNAQSGRELLAYFTRQRSAALEAAEPELSLRIAVTENPAELEALVQRYLPLPMDQQQRAGTALFTRVAEQQQELHKRQVLISDAATPAAPPVPVSQVTTVPVAAAVATTATATSPTTETTANGEPSASDMYDAVQAALQNVNATARDTAANCNHGNFQNDPFLAVQCLSYSVSVGVTNGGSAVKAPEFKISHFNKLGCEKAVGYAGWRCDYELGISGNVQLPPSLAQLVAGGTQSQARFLRRGDGWIVIMDP